MYLLYLTYLPHDGLQPQVTPHYLAIKEHHNGKCWPAVAEQQIYCYTLDCMIYPLLMTKSRHITMLLCSLFHNTYLLVSVIDIFSEPLHLNAGYVSHWCVQPPPHRTISISYALPLLSCVLFWPVLLSLVLSVEFPHLLEGVTLKPSLTIDTAVCVVLEEILYLLESSAYSLRYSYIQRLPISLTVRSGGGRTAGWCGAGGRSAAEMDVVLVMVHSCLVACTLRRRSCR